MKPTMDRHSGAVPRACLRTVILDGKPVPGYRTEIRSRWTKDNLYLLFICPYEELYLKPSPDTANETNKLWNWDVAEAFIGSDFQNIKHYKEFELSPQGEWIDLDIKLEKPHHEDGWTWNSGFQVSARIDQAAHIWYGAMRIPFAAIDSRHSRSGEYVAGEFLPQPGTAPQPQRSHLAAADERYLPHAGAIWVAETD